MRLLITNLLATALVLFGAASASAVSVSMTSDYNGVDILGVGDRVTVSVFLNANVVGIQLLSVGVQFDPSIWQYNPQPTVPTYILYGMSGSGMTAMTTQLEAQQDPWQLWPGATIPPGVGQVNVNFADPSFVGTLVTNPNVQIATIELEVHSLGDGESTIAITSLSGGNVLQVAGVVQPLPTAGNFTVYTPEPGTAVLVGLGLLGLGVAGRRRA
jgi:hypothetical protein